MKKQITLFFAVLFLFTVQDSFSQTSIFSKIKKKQHVLVPKSKLKAGKVALLCDSAHYYSYSETGDSTLKRRTIYTYDKDGNLIADILHILHGTKWEDTLKNEYINKNINISEGIEYRWDIQKQSWINNSKTSYNYTNNDYNIETIVKKWDTVKNVWINTLKEFYKLDTYGNDTLSEKYLWNETDAKWVIDERESITYNADEKMIRDKTYSNNFSTGSLDGITNTEYHYDKNKRLTGFNEYIWDKNKKDWVIHSKEELNFKSDSLSATSDISVYSSSADVWTVVAKEEYTFDAKGNPIHTIQKEWDAFSFSWQTSGRVDKTFDSNGEQISFKFYDYLNDYYGSNGWILNFNSNNLIDSNASLTWDYDNSKWTNSELFLFYNSNHEVAEVTGIDEKNDDINIYPNPTNDKVTVSLNSDNTRIAIYDSFGTLISVQQTTVNRTVISLATFQSGIYNMIVTTGETQITKKIIVEK